MKKYIILILLFFNACLCLGQNLYINYKFEVKNTMFNKLFEFPAILQLDKDGQKLYSVSYGIAAQAKEDNLNGGFSLIDTAKYSYILYSNNSEKHYISDVIRNKAYLFEDTFSLIKFNITKEYKIDNNIKLTKAETEFRGRKYIIWFDASSNIKGGPWKFSNLPGIAYEIYDEENIFHWTLQNIVKKTAPFKNPFVNLGQSVLSFKEYPALKYTTSVHQHNPATNKGEYVQYNQKRDGLEILFEWEN